MQAFSRQTWFESWSASNWLCGLSEITAPLWTFSFSIKMFSFWFVCSASETRGTSGSLNYLVWNSTWIRYFVSEEGPPKLIEASRGKVYLPSTMGPLCFPPTNTQHLVYLRFEVLLFWYFKIYLCSRMLDTGYWWCAYLRVSVFFPFDPWKGSCDTRLTIELGFHLEWRCLFSNHHN